jgi:hypothetical protein
MTGSDRRRRRRAAVETALWDVMLLGTPDQVRLAVEAANDMVAGRNVETAALVASFRTFIREVLDLGEVPADVSVLKQGTLLRVGGSTRAARGERASGTDGGRSGGQTGEGVGAGGMGLGASAEEPDGSAHPWRPPRMGLPTGRFAAINSATAKSFGWPVDRIENNPSQVRD